MLLMIENIKKDQMFLTHGKIWDTYHKIFIFNNALSENTQNGHILQRKLMKV